MEGEKDGRLGRRKDIEEEMMEGRRKRRKEKEKEGVKKEVMYDRRKELLLYSVFGILASRTLTLTAFCVFQVSRRVSLNASSLLLSFI